MLLAPLLGPYRNLTTLTASILALHPDCQVLNHAAERLLSDSGLDFFSKVDAHTFNSFVGAALEASEGGQRGDFGGSILHSHAYDDPEIRALYIKRYGDQKVKVGASCLVWKDSMRIQLRLMQEQSLFERLTATFSNLRFIMPIRNPLDCAISNLSTGHVRHFGNCDHPTPEYTIDRVLDAYAWVLNKHDQNPDRIFVFTQYDEPSMLFKRLSDFLNLSPSERWIQDAVSTFKMRRSYQHSVDSIKYASSVARARLERWPDILKKLGYQRN